MSVSSPSNYSNKKILLVGEGDFSFSLCLAKHSGSSTNITATSLDTREELERNYENARENIEELKRLGCVVLHGLNVHSMAGDWRTMLWTLFDVVVFNFPHAGHGFGPERCSSTIMKHQEVVRGFLRNARQMVKVTGEIHVTHKRGGPFELWDIQTLGEENGLSLVRELGFDTSQFPGYSNKHGSGYKCDSSFPVGLSSTFVFRK